MKKGGGSSKGSGFEREIAKKLSLWWSGSVTDNIFWRTAISGARGTTRQRRGQDTTSLHGDLQAIVPSGQPLMDVFVIELKRGYGRWCALDLLDSKARKSVLARFMNQLYDSAGSAMRRPMLIVQRDRCSPLVFIPSAIYRGLNQHRELRTLELKFGESRFMDTTIVRLDEFCKCVPPAAIRNLALACIEDHHSTNTLRKQHRRRDE